MTPFELQRLKKKSAEDKAAGFRKGVKVGIGKVKGAVAKVKVPKGPGRKKTASAPKAKKTRAAKKTASAKPKGARKPRKKLTGAALTQFREKMAAGRARAKARGRKQTPAEKKAWAGSEYGV